MGEKRKYMEDELSRFEAEISGASSGAGGNNLFIPSQIRPIVCANTYSQVAQKLQQHPPPKPGPAPPLNNVSPPPIAPAFVPTFMPHEHSAPPEKSYSSEPTPVVLSSAPKLYTNRLSINPTEIPVAPQIDISSIQFDVTNKLKKLKTEKVNGPNPIAEAAIQAAKASSALQNFRINEKRKKDKKTVRVAGGQVWEDPSLADWDGDDFRIFCGDLGNDVNDELVTRTFNKFPSFMRAKVIRDKRTGKSKGFGFVSFKEPADFIRAMKEMDEYFLEGKETGFRKGMKLEAVDPLNLSSICVATVVEVLKFGYMMIRIDTYDPDITGADLFCYHEKSACIFPPGFCQRNNITLTPPKGYDSKTFSWQQYLSDTKSIPSSESLFCLEVPNHGFKEGMKIECADLMDLRLVCVATIVKIVGRVVRVHFDGWEDEFDQWLDSEGPDMYPVGWCVMVGHKLEAPKPPVVQKISPKSTGKKGRRKSGRAGGKGKTAGPRSVKREIDMSEQRQQDFDESQNGDSLTAKTETTQQDFDGEEDDDDFSHDGYSHSINSMQSTSLPPTPEPRNETPTLHTTRPSSKSSAFSIVSHNSGAATSSPPPERKATSYIQNTTVTSGKYIPCLISGSTAPQSNASASNGDELAPDSWNMFDVGQFLRVNDCAAHCETFSRHKVDGKRLLEITDDEIFRMLNMKVGPALKVQDLIKKLRDKIDKMKPSRHSTGKGSVTKKYL